MAIVRVGAAGFDVYQKCLRCRPENGSFWSGRARDRASGGRRMLRMLAVTSPEFSVQREKRTEEIFRGGINGCDGSTFFAARDKGVVFRINYSVCTDIL